MSSPSRVENQIRHLHLRPSPYTSQLSLPHLLDGLHDRLYLLRISSLLQELQTVHCHAATRSSKGQKGKMAADDRSGEEVGARETAVALSIVEVRERAVWIILRLVHDLLYDVSLLRGKAVPEAFALA